MIKVNGLLVGNNLRTLSTIRQSVGMVFQQFNLFNHLSILDNLMLAPMLVKKMNKAQALELAMHYLHKVKIADQAHKFPQALSGGQQQRAAIARSLCMQPSIMLFDEPTSALDPEMIKEVLEVIHDLAQQGMTMICVTHEMAFARKIADNVVFMDLGEIVEIAPPQQFFQAPKEPRVQKFLSQILDNT
jgi:general L-amino acid transport system ATP-binding protein